MRKSKADFQELLVSGDYYVLQKKHDANLDDVVLRREDGQAAEIANYPYRINQMPAYMLREFLAEGFLEKADAGELGTVFRPVKIKRESSAQAA